MGAGRAKLARSVHVHFGDGRHQEKWWGLGRRRMCDGRACWPTSAGRGRTC
jgi:hypothetical protein